MTTPTYSEALNTIMDALETAQKTILTLASELEEARAKVTDAYVMLDAVRAENFKLKSAAIMPETTGELKSHETFTRDHSFVRTDGTLTR